MKKLFSVLLVLALCGLASSETVDFYITNSAGSNNIMIAPMTDINLYVWYSSSTNLSTFDVNAIILESSPKGSFTGGAITATNRDTDFDWVGLYSSTYIEVAGVALDLTTDPPVGQALGQGVANPLAMIFFHCDAAGDVTIDLAFVAAATTGWTELSEEYGDTITTHGMTINQIPEPASVVLLIFGGLALLGRRRKKS